MSRRGTTLVELLIASVLGAAIVAAVCGFARAEGRLLEGETTRLRVRETSRRIVGMIVHELRHAGHAPRPGSFDGERDGVSLAFADRVELRSDLHGAAAGDREDGILDADSDERTGFTWNARRRTVMLETGRQTSALTADGAVPAFTLRYFDPCGDELVPGAIGLGPDERARVRAVRAALVTVDPRDGLPIAASGTAVLRNREDLACE